jgi:hypothetical protein
MAEEEPVGPPSPLAQPASLGSPVSGSAARDLPSPVEGTLTNVAVSAPPLNVDHEPFDSQLPVSKKTYPFRALARKTLVYQKRQIFVNVCCVGLCPL